LAHQWFGDSVAPSEWSDVWQNEGHATWYEYNYANETGTFAEYSGFPSLQEFFKYVYSRGDIYRATWGPVARPNSSATIWDVFNSNVYYGGALVLYALQQKVGAATFQQIERTWVSVYRGRSASTADFIRVASLVSHQDLRSFLNGWLYGTTTPAMPGHADWTVTPVPASAAALAPATDRLRSLVR
jgi:aminopeptidase N